MKSILSKIQHFFIKMQDILITDILYLIPCAFNWFYHLKIKKDISSFRLIDKNDKKAILYQHGQWNPEENEAQAILILHGLYSHPFVMLHLVEMAQKANLGPVFSLYVSYDEVNLDHRPLIQQTFDMIEKMSPNLKGIIVVGHSMGAMEGAYSAFVEKDKRVISVISIAGRLKVVECTHSPCRDSLKSTVNQIYEGIQSMPKLPLYQIVGRKDWNASLESTLVRHDKSEYHIIEDAMHFNILFHRNIYAIFPQYLQKSSQKK